MVAGTSGRIEKKILPKKVMETRHAKIVNQKQKDNEGITDRRMNLLRALNKVKTDQNDDKQQYSEGDGKYVRSDEDCSDQSSYDGMEQISTIDTIKNPRKRRSPASNASSDNSNDWLKLLPPLPLEPPPKTEYNQEEFLNLFNLITPRVAELVKLKRSKRKRRNCFKNEKNDFHYGNFDLNDVSNTIRLQDNFYFI